MADHQHERHESSVSEDVARCPASMLVVVSDDRRYQLMPSGRRSDSRADCRPSTLVAYVPRRCCPAPDK
ncbi:MAG: hypothetical protein ACLRSE_11605 [Alistipes finegoldii]